MTIRHDTRRSRGTAVVSAALLAMAVAGCASAGDEQGSSADGSDAATETASGAAGEGGSLPDVIRVGVPLDTSGSPAIEGIGQAERDGVEFATKKLNESGALGDSQIELVFTDTQGDPQQAVQAVTRYLNQDYVHAVVGFTLSPSFFAAAPLLVEAGIPTMAVGTSAAGITDEGENIFRAYMDSTRYITDQPFVDAFGTESAVYFYGSDTETTVGQYEHRSESLSEAGVEEVGVQTMVTDDTDVRAQMTQLESADPDAFVFDVNAGQVPTVINQADEVGLLDSVDHIFGNIGLASDDVLAEVGDAANCAVFSTTWDINSEAGTNPDFVAGFEEEYGRAPDTYVAWGYDGMLAMGTAIAEAGSVGADAVIEALNTIEVEGVLGTYDYDDNRQPTFDPVLMQIRDQRPVIWSPDMEPCTRS